MKALMLCICLISLAAVAIGGHRPRRRCVRCHHPCRHPSDNFLKRRYPGLFMTREERNQAELYEVQTDPNITTTRQVKRQAGSSCLCPQDCELAMPTEAEDLNGMTIIIVQGMEIGQWIWQCACSGSTSQCNSCQAEGVLHNMLADTGVTNGAGNPVYEFVQVAISGVCCCGTD